MPEPIGSEERKLVSKLLNTFMRPTEGAFPLANRDLTIRTGNDDIQGRREDPTEAFALYLLQREYPELFQRVGEIGIGEPQSPGIAGTTTPSMYGPGATLSIGPQDSFRRAMGITRHELSHVAGLKDPGHNQPITAYDVGDLSDLLHRDVTLDRQGIENPLIKYLMSRER